MGTQPRLRDSATTTRSWPALEARGGCERPAPCPRASIPHTGRRRARKTTSDPYSTCSRIGGCCSSPARCSARSRSAGDVARAKSSRRATEPPEASISVTQYSILSPQSPRSDFTLRAEQINQETSVAALAEKVAQALITARHRHRRALSGVVAPRSSSARPPDRGPACPQPLTEDGVGKVEIRAGLRVSRRGGGYCRVRLRVFVEMNRQVHLEDVRGCTPSYGAISNPRTALVTEADRPPSKRRHGGRPYEKHR